MANSLQLRVFMAATGNTSPSFFSKNRLKAETQDRKIQSIIMFLTSLVKPCVFV